MLFHFIDFSSKVRHLIFLMTVGGVDLPKAENTKSVLQITAKGEKPPKCAVVSQIIDKFAKHTGRRLTERFRARS